MLDEMTLRSAFSYDKRNDCVEGIEDFGPVLGKSKYAATHALVFMVRGLKDKWKHPLGFFFYWFYCET